MLNSEIFELARDERAVEFIVEQERARARRGDAQREPHGLRDFLERLTSVLTRTNMCPGPSLDLTGR